MKSIYKFLLYALNSNLSVLAVVFFCCASFYLGQTRSDMGIFAASGAVMTIFGLFSMIRFTTIEKYLRKEEIIANSTGVTGPPLRTDQIERLEKENIARANVQIHKELRSELKGIILTIVGTMIWAYGAYIPVFDLVKSHI